jgi:small subunit ribosomal protein S24e
MCQCEHQSDGNAMKVRVTSQRYNPLLKRKEVVFEAEHNPHEGTLSRVELRKNVAEILKVNVDLVFIQRAVTKTGSMVTVGEANVYDTFEQAKLAETKHIFDRNVPPPPKPAEETAEPAAAAAAKSKEEAKPKEAEKKPKEA